MRTIDAVRGSLIAALCAAAGAFAQEPTSVLPNTVMTDVTVAPAEERDSVGAVVMEDSMVRAQREMFGVRSTPKQVQAIGRGVMRATLATARSRDVEGPDTRQLGGPPAPERIAPGIRE